MQTAFQVHVCWSRTSGNRQLRAVCPERNSRGFGPQASTGCSFRHKSAWLGSYDRAGIATARVLHLETEQVAFRRFHALRGSPHGFAGTRMLFEALTENFQRSLAALRGLDKITETNIEPTLKEVRRALIDADVNVKVVDILLAAIKEQALNMKVVKGVTPGQQFVKIVYDELIRLLGGDPATSSSKAGASPLPALAESPTKPTVILMAGLQGAGKTTQSAKLARLLQTEKRSRKKVLLVAADVQRPAAVEQLQTLGQQIETEVFIPAMVGTGSVTALEVATRALDYAKQKAFDFMIVDTAGRQVIDERLMEELQQIKRVLSPAEILLVVDGMIGQEAANITRAFHERIGITGAILTKMDGDTRGGAALSIKQISGAPIKFIGVGEKLDKLEKFYPDRMASRILGMGDIITLVERAQEAVDEKEAEQLARKMLEARFDFNDFLRQTRFVRSMGSFAGVLKLLPGVSGMLKEDQLRAGEKRLRLAESVINSMTPRERANPDLLTVDKTAASRMRRIARGSGRSLEQVESLMRDFVNMRNVMAQMSRRMMGGGSGAGPVPSNASQNPGDLATNLASGDLASNIGNRAARRKLNKKKSDASSSKKSGFGFKQ
jgi:signal recognition particle subunit SRP54